MMLIKKFIHELTLVEKEINKCIQCGMCQSVCPVYKITRNEGDVARGKLALFKGLLFKETLDIKNILSKIENCLLCGACGNKCPRQIDTLNVLISIRLILNSYIGMSWEKKIVLQNILSHPKTADNVLSLLRNFQKPLIKTSNDFHKSKKVRFSWLKIARRNFIQLAPTFSHAQVRSEQKSLKFEETNIAIFTGCLIDKFFPKMALDTVKVLNFHGYYPALPNYQGCCGLPALTSGDFASFIKLVQYNLNLFEVQKFDYIVSPCSTCVSTIKMIWPFMLKSQPKFLKDKADQFSKKILDISDFTANVLIRNQDKKNDITDKIKLTYHDPCHLKKGLGIHEEPRQLLNFNKKYKLIEMENADACCGMGGSFGVQHVELSNSICDRKIDQIKKTDCKIVATSCPACCLQLIDGLTRSNTCIQVLHPIQIYAESIGN